MTADARRLGGWLRGQLGFDGVIISDYSAIGDLRHHGIAADLPEAAALALNAGVDIDMMADAYRRGLPVALERGLVSMAQIDAAVRRVLVLKERLGLFDDPYRRGATQEDAATLARRRELARSVAGRAIVMLKNEGDSLPLGAALRRLAVLGPLADAPQEMSGPWWGAAAKEGQISALAGLRAAWPAAEILHAAGVAIDGDDRSGIASALALCGTADAIILCVGESAAMSGEAASRAHLGLPGCQRRFAEAVLDRAKELGKPVIAVLFCGRPLVLPWLFERADAVLAAWFLGSEAGHALADVVSGRISPSGRTPVTWPRALGQVPIFYGLRPGGRPEDAHDRFTSKYLDVPNSPQFPFGHGLSYGRFTFANLRVAPQLAGEADRIEARVDVTNSGRQSAEETVFLFTRDPVASVTRPLLELQAFAKIVLAPGESGTVTLGMPAAQLRFAGADLAPIFEAGELEVLVGPAADRSRLLAAKIRLVG
jgi:beta-glucosidase